MITEHFLTPGTRKPRPLQNYSGLLLSALLVFMSVLLILIPRMAHGEQCQYLQAQNDSTVPISIHLGLRGSLNWVTFHGEDADNRFAESTFKLRYVPAVGVIVGILSTKDFLAWRAGLDVDASYVTKGSGITVDGEERGSLDLHYYDLTLLARLEREAGGNLGGYLLLGPGMSFLREAIHVSPSGEADRTGETTDRDWRIVAGVGVRWALYPNHHFTLDVRTDIGTRTIDATVNNTEFKNLAISLSLGYQWSYPPRVTQAGAVCPDS
jgi:hypothetical protein